jgi:hypothetical protein
MGFVQDKQTFSVPDGLDEADLQHLEHGPERGFDPARVHADYAVGGRPPPFPSSMTPGKGVRAVRCVGCREDTLPRPEDSAPLCQRCSDLLASSADGPETWSAWTAQRAPKWLRWRSSMYL